VSINEPKVEKDENFAAEMMAWGAKEGQCH